jgi:hypothetical protein
MTIINEDSRVINKLKTSLTDDAIVLIYYCHMFIVQATVSLCHFNSNYCNLFQDFYGGQWPRKVESQHDAHRIPGKVEF